MLLRKFYNEKNIFYPKDVAKNGTWFAVSENGNAIVLLNGAFENHDKKSEYRKSRGLIVLDLIVEENIFSSIELIDLEYIEPFTLVVFQQNNLAEFRWDGSDKHFKILDSKIPHIWSSATLYDVKAQEKRMHIFEEFIQSKIISTDSIWDFHHQRTDDLENGITIKRQNTIQTISTTQVVISDEIMMKHSDRLKNTSKREEIFLKNEFKT